MGNHNKFAALSATIEIGTQSTDGITIIGVVTKFTVLTKSFEHFHISDRAGSAIVLAAI